MLRHHSLLIINPQLEARRTPINKLNGPTRLNTRNRLVGVSRDDIATVQKRTGHVMCGTGVTNNHLIVGFKALEGDVLDAVGFMLGFGFGDDGGTGDQGVVDSWVRDEIGLEFGEVDVQGAFEAEGGGDG
jgi:hypothetical protein